MNSILANIFKAKSYPENKDMKTTDIRIILYNICVYIYMIFYLHELNILITCTHDYNRDAE